MLSNESKTREEKVANDQGEWRRVIQHMAKDGIEKEKPVNIVYGKVTSVSPLEIWLNQAITLDKEHIVLSRCVTDYERDEEVSWVTESSASHTHNVKGVKRVKVLDGLKSGETVILLQLQGGQKFLVLDRVVSA